MSFRQDQGRPGRNGDDFQPNQPTPEEVEAMHRAGDETVKPRTSGEAAQAAALAVKEHGIELASFGVSKARDQLMIRWAEDHRLSQMHRLVLAWLCHHTNAKTGYTFVSFELLAAECNRPVKTIRNVVSELATAGWIVKTNGHQKNVVGKKGPSYAILPGNRETWEASSDRLVATKEAAKEKVSRGYKNVPESRDDIVPESRDDANHIVPESRDDVGQIVPGARATHITSEKGEPLKKGEPLRGTADAPPSDPHLRSSPNGMKDVNGSHHSQPVPCNSGHDDCSRVNDLPDDNLFGALNLGSIARRAKDGPDVDDVLGPFPADASKLAPPTLNLGHGSVSDPVSVTASGITAHITFANGKSFRRHVTRSEIIAFASRIGQPVAVGQEWLATAFRRWAAEGHAGGKAHEWLGRLYADASAAFYASKAAPRDRGPSYELPPLKPYRREI